MESNLENAMTVALVGFTVSFITLLFFATLIKSVNKIDKAITANKKKKETAKQQTAINSCETATNEDENIIPVIAAAVTAAVGKNVVIRKINFVQGASANTSWSNTSIAKNHEMRNIQVSRRNYDK